MFSTTTMASSTRMPIEKISANSDTRFSVKPQAHEANSVTVSVRITAVPTIAASRRPSAKNTSATTEAVANSSFWISLLRLVVGGGAVVARLGDLHVGRDHGVAQRVDALHHRVGDVDGVLARLLGHRQRHGRVLGTPRRPCRPRRARRSARPAAGRRARVATSRRNTGLPSRTPTTSSPTSRRCAGTGPTRSPPRGCRRSARRPAGRGWPTAAPRAGRRTVTPAPAMRAGSISTSTARPGPPIVVHLARAGHALQVGLDAVRHALQVVGAGRRRSC